MRQKKTGYLKTASILLIIEVFYVLCLSHPAVFAKCPEIVEGFKLTDIYGKPAQLNCSSQKVFVVTFWATWCPPCKAEIPGLNEIFKAYNGKGVTVIGIALQSIAPVSIRSFAKSYNIHYPVFIGEAKDFKSQSRIISIPATFIFDSNGKLHKTLIGFHSKSELESHIKSLLE